MLSLHHKAALKGFWRTAEPRAGGAARSRENYKLTLLLCSQLFLCYNSCEQSKILINMEQFNMRLLRRVIPLPRIST